MGQSLARDIQAVNLTVTLVSCNGTVLDTGSVLATRHRSQGRPFQDLAEEHTEPGGRAVGSSQKTRLAELPGALFIFLGKPKGSANGNITSVTRSQTYKTFVGDSFLTKEPEWGEI